MGGGSLIFGSRERRWGVLRSSGPEGRRWGSSSIFGADDSCRLDSQDNGQERARAGGRLRGFEVARQISIRRHHQLRVSEVLRGERFVDAEVGFRGYVLHEYLRRAAKSSFTKCEDHVADRPSDSLLPFGAKSRRSPAGKACKILLVSSLRSSQRRSLLCLSSRSCR